MATIAELLGEAKVKAAAATARPDRRVEAMHIVAAGLKGSPYKRDANGRLRRNGRFAPLPPTSGDNLDDNGRLLCAIFGHNPWRQVPR